MAVFGLQSEWDRSREVVVSHVAAHRKSVKEVRIDTSQFSVGAILFPALLEAPKCKFLSDLASDLRFDDDIKNRFECHRGLIIKKGKNHSNRKREG